MTGRLALGLAAGLVAALLAWWAWPLAERPDLPAHAAGDLAAVGAASAAGPSRDRPLGKPTVAAVAAPASAAAPAAVGLSSGAAATGQPVACTALLRCQAQAEAARASPIDSAAALADLARVPEPDEGQLAAAWGRTARQLQGSPDLRDQAAALLMSRPSAAEGSLNLALPVAAVSSLVTLALGSADPTVLRWAAGACAASHAPAACQDLLPRAWVQAEPDNLLAWLPLLAQAPQAKEEALQGMAQARRADGGWMRWAAVVHAAIPSDLPPALRHAFGLRLTHLGTTEPIPAWQPLMQACKDEALTDARRRGQCAQIAQLMVDQGRELVTVFLGYAIGKRLGWPAEREQAHQALRAAARKSGLDWWQPGITQSCQGHLHAHWLAQVNQLGEAELARQWLRSAASVVPAARQASAAR